MLRLCSFVLLLFRSKKVIKVFLHFILKSVQQTCIILMIN